MCQTLLLPLETFCSLLKYPGDLRIKRSLTKKSVLPPVPHFLNFSSLPQPFIYCRGTSHWIPFLFSELLSLLVLIPFPSLPAGILFILLLLDPVFPL